MTINFWDLTDEQILKGMQIMIGSRTQDGSAIDTAFAYDGKIQKMTSMWLFCKRDRVLMKLTYADEIAALNYDSVVTKYKGMILADQAMFYCPYIPL
jgi:hypothetical protein